MALVATYLGEVDEEKINNMSYNFFQDILKQLGKKLNYDAVVNYAGNGFCEKSWEMIQEHNPMSGSGEHHGAAMKNLANFFAENVQEVKNGGEALPGKGFNGRDKRGV